MMITLRESHINPRNTYGTSFSIQSPVKDCALTLATQKYHVPWSLWLSLRCFTVKVSEFPRSGMVNMLRKPLTLPAEMTKMTSLEDVPWIRTAVRNSYVLSHSFYKSCFANSDLIKIVLYPKSKKFNLKL